MIKRTALKRFSLKYLLDIQSYFSPAGYLSSSQYAKVVGSVSGPGTYKKQSVALTGVDWVLSCKPKGHWFDSQTGHVPGLLARFLVGGIQESTN